MYNNEADVLLPRDRYKYVLSRFEDFYQISESRLLRAVLDAESVWSEAIVKRQGQNLNKVLESCPWPNTRKELLEKGRKLKAGRTATLYHPLEERTGIRVNIVSSRTSSSSRL